jgi:hypothetical protein
MAPQQPRIHRNTLSKKHAAKTAIDRPCQAFRFPDGQKEPNAWVVLRIAGSATVSPTPHIFYICMWAASEAAPRSVTPKDKNGRERRQRLAEAGLGRPT